MRRSQSPAPADHAPSRTPAAAGPALAMPLAPVAAPAPPLPAVDRVGAGAIAAYLAIMLGLSAALSLALVALLGAEAASGLVVLGMLVPGLVALAVELAHRARRPRAARTPLGLVFATRGPGARPWLGILAALAAYLAVAAARTGILLALGLAVPRPVEDAAALAIAVLAQLAIMAVGATGEELGWRGWLQTRLGRFGLPVAVAVTAAAWVAFHVPIMAATGGLSAAQWAATLSGIAAAAVLLAVLRDRFASVWPAVAGHALMNTVLVAASSSLVQPAAGAAPALIGGVVDAALLLAAAAAVAALPRPRAAEVPAEDRQLP